MKICQILEDDVKLMLSQREAEVIKSQRMIFADADTDADADDADADDDGGDIFCAQGELLGQPAKRA